MSLDLWFYNLRVGRPQRQIERETIAILEGAKPDVLGLCEAGGSNLLLFAGYTRLRDVSRPGRANIAAYVRDDLEPKHVRWHDMAQTWKRTEHDTNEDHPPRSWLEFYASGVQYLIAHQPPKVRSGAETIRCQREGIDSYVAAMAPWTRPDWAARTDDSKARARARTRVLLWDPNRGPEEPGPGPKRITERVSGACTVGESHIEGAVVRRGQPSNPTLPQTVNGVRLLSDHDHAFRFQLKVA